MESAKSFACAGTVHRDFAGGTGRCRSGGLTVEYCTNFTARRHREGLNILEFGVPPYLQIKGNALKAAGKSALGGCIRTFEIFPSGRLDFREWRLPGTEPVDPEVPIRSSLPTTAIGSRSRATRSSRPVYMKGGSFYLLARGSAVDGKTVLFKERA